MKNRIIYSCKKLTKKLSKSIEELNMHSKKYTYSKETHDLLIDIIRKAYNKSLISESEFISLINILGKNKHDFNNKGFIEKSVVFFFAEIISDKL